jgi:hypothetical protein
MNNKEIKVNGVREFESGAKRDPNTSKGRYDLLSPLFLKRLALHTQKGGQIRGDRDWETGMPMDAVLDSAIRHLFNFLEGDRSEDHLAAAAWNVMNLIHVEEQIERGNLPKELANGLPDYTIKVSPVKFEDVYVDPEEDTYPPVDIEPLPMGRRTEKPLCGPEPDCSDCEIDVDCGGKELVDGPYESTGKPHENWESNVLKENRPKECPTCARRVFDGNAYGPNRKDLLCVHCNQLSNWRAK